MTYERNNIEWMSVVAEDRTGLERRPREKVEQKGIGSLSDLELVTLLISSGSADRSAVEIANELLGLLDSSEDPGFQALCTIRGMGKAKASTILAAIELGRRRQRLAGSAYITSPGDIFREVRHYATRDQEQFIVLVLNGAHEVLNTFVSTVGLVNKTLVHPREVFSDPIARRATAVALAHNHPSGQLSPSDDDIAVTERLVRSGNLLGIRVLDHLIFTTAGYYSFMEHGIMPDGRGASV